MKALVTGLSLVGSLALGSCGGEVEVSGSGPLAALAPPVTAPAAPVNPCPDPDTTGVKVVPPASGAYHGAFLSIAPDQPVTDATISDMEALAGKPLAVVYFDNAWGHDGLLDLRFPTASVQTIWNHGAVPFIRLMPWTTRTEYQADPVVSMKTFVDTTRYDATVTAWLLAAKATKLPLMVEFGVEVNGTWFPWNGHWNGAGKKTWRDPAWPDGPEAYRLAYQKLITLARSNNVWNLTWAFHVSHWPDPSEPSASWNQMKYYYPGDSYIDWLGLSCYGEMHPFGKPIQWNPITDLLGTTNPQLSGGLSPYQELTRLTASTTKPMALLETGVVEDPAAGDKAAWIQATYAAVTSSPLARLHLVDWWNERWDNEPPLGPSDMRINSSAATLAGYRAAVAASSIVATPSFRCTKQALP
jgi:hypothetical protein